MGATRHIQIGRQRAAHFHFLLSAMVLMLALRPFLVGWARIGLLTDIFFFLILLTGAYALRDQGRIFAAFLAIALPTLLLEVISYFFPSEPVRIIGRILLAMFLAYVLGIILFHIFNEKEVTKDLIMGAACAYLLIGLVWAFLFYFLELAAESSFASDKTLLKDAGSFFYFSFATLTTLGYGDIVPRTGQARALAVLEAVTGQLYLAITIARLVGIYASSHSSEGDDIVRPKTGKKR